MDWIANVNQSHSEWLWLAVSSPEAPPLEPQSADMRQTAASLSSWVCTESLFLQIRWDQMHRYLLKCSPGRRPDLQHLSAAGRRSVCASCSHRCGCWSTDLRSDDFRTPVCIFCFNATTWCALMRYFIGFSNRGPWRYNRGSFWREPWQEEGGSKWRFILQRMVRQATVKGAIRCIQTIQNCSQSNKQ